MILSKCDANIFYMEKSKEFWDGTSLRMDNVFVAPNTTDVLVRDFVPESKKDFLFVGTLYRGKGLELLLNAFLAFKESTNSKIKLVIVGGGEMEGKLKQFVSDNRIEDSVLFTGPIYEEEELSNYFVSSLLCFSPTQAGLSVPKSMGYGVPFVTRKDAITGGELYHITDKVNGVLYSEDEQLLSIMVDANAHRDKYVEMGKKARDYYFSNATIKHMADGAMAAFRY
jgi:glycosyltransferase involved in cell wall biosynthesis